MNPALHNECQITSQDCRSSLKHGHMILTLNGMLKDYYGVVHSQTGAIEIRIRVNIFKKFQSP